MRTELEPKRCPRCGEGIVAEAPRGLCPKCLLLQASFPTEAGQGPVSTGAQPTHEQLAAAFPHLEILELIGQGGMGFVFKARQPRLERLVALKILPQSLAADPAFAERFSREGRILARLNHPNIVTIHDFGQANGYFYLLMEFVDGVNLRQAMRSGRFTPAQALTVVPKICEALQFAHNEGILHRDIKPENILLDGRGRLKIADFGIAKLVRAGALAGGMPEAAQGDGGPGGEPPGEAALTETGKVVGTPNYMAPEQLENPQDVDQRADIYSLGVVFYEMLTGELPVGRFAPPSKKSGVDPRLDEVVLHTLEKKRERRTPSASEVKTQVETIAGNGAGTVAALEGRKAETRRNRARSIAWLVGVAAVILIVSVAPSFLSRQAANRPGAGARQSSPELICEILRTDVGRQLREAGATYDDLRVTVAVNRDSATPFRVSYEGLQNFNAPDGTVLSANGEFIMEYRGSGLWRGALAGMEFSVPVGSKDKIDLPFVDDPEVVGEWESVDFIAQPADFKPEGTDRRGKLFLKGLTFLAGGKTSEEWRTWTRGVLIHHGDQTASHYEIRKLNGTPYLFLEWKSGDVTVRGLKPQYYVLRRKA